MDPVRAGAIQTLYIQARNSAAAAAIVTLYMVATAAPFSSHLAIGLWLAVQVVTQALREILLRAYRRRAPPPEELPRWALAYTLYMAVAGCVWGSTIVLFAHPEAPITMALTLCGLYGISAGSVPGNAYNPAGLYAFVSLIFGAVLVRLLALGAFEYAVLAFASAGFAAIMIMFCRVQARTIDEGFRIRFENVALLAELRMRTAEAEQARHAAELASLAKSKFLAAASHDLRQPLYALSLFSASLQDLELNAEGRRVIDNIQVNVGALESLFDGLLDISKLEAGVVTARIARVSVDALFDRLSHYFGPLAVERGLKLRMRPSGRTIWTDPALLEQILSNLIGNAIRYTTAGGVLVALRARGGTLRFDVYDTGVGIDGSDQDRIFDEFVQLGNPERNRQRGIGLGLSIARRSAALLGGRIAVRSVAGRGSCFSFIQPEAAPVAEASPSEPVIPALAPVANLPVLIVEDDHNVRMALSDLMGKWNILFDIVVDAAEALERVARGARYGVVLADYRLPGDMDGLALIAALKARHPAPPPLMVLVTGDLDPRIIALADRQQVPLIHKPLKAAQLRALLNTATAEV